MTGPKAAHAATKQTDRRPGGNRRPIRAQPLRGSRQTPSRL